MSVEQYQSLTQRGMSRGEALYEMSKEKGETESYSKTEVDNLLESKVDDTEFSALETEVGEKADADLVSTNISNLQNNKADKSQLFSGSYNDLTDTPTIPTVPVAAYVDPSTGTVADVVNALIAAGLMESG